MAHQQRGSDTISDPSSQRDIGSDAVNHSGRVHDEASTSDRAGNKSDARGKHPNNVRKLRIERMMSKAELARRAGLSVLTIDRVEKGYPCRLGTKRKILEALDLGLAERVNVFGEEE